MLRLSGKARAGRTTGRHDQELTIDHADFTLPPDLVATEASVPTWPPPGASRRRFLSALGVRLDGEGLSQTPARMAKAYAELFDPKPLRLTTFPNIEGYDELVIARDIPFRTVCEHHLLPFSGVPRSVTCRASVSSGCPSWPGWSSISPPGRRCRSGSPSRSRTAWTTAARRGVGRDAGRAHLHDAARGPGPRRQDGDLGPARHPARRSAVPDRVLRASWPVGLARLNRLGGRQPTITKLD